MTFCVTEYIRIQSWEWIGGCGSLSAALSEGL